MKIIALGDSLTVGEGEFDLYDSVGPSSYPEYLEMVAQEHLRGLKSSVKVNVLNRGISGDLTSGMLERFSKDVVDEKTDYVIILGGTNDIGWGFDPVMIVHNLTTMYDNSRNKDIVAVACSVPSILGFDEFIPPRLHLNQMIRTEADKRSMPFVDLFTATADPRNNRLRQDYSADGLHLTPEGYQQIGRCIFDKWLRPLLEEQTK